MHINQYPTNILGHIFFLQNEINLRGQATDHIDQPLQKSKFFHYGEYESPAVSTKLNCASNKIINRSVIFI